MTLTTRVSVFFLTFLAVVLLGFSASLFWLARAHLTREVEERLEAALQTLSAAAEMEGPLIDWEPAEHHLVLGRSDSLSEARWIVADERDSVIDLSANLASDDFLANVRFSSDGLVHSQVIRSKEGAWQVAQKLIVSSEMEAPADAHSTPESKRHYHRLKITAAVSLDPLYDSLRFLGITLGSLSLGLWTVAALAGHWLGRRALSPVAQMAAAARSMKGTDMGQRLPVTGTRDELEDLSHAFNNLLDRLQESFERQRRFTGDASHQLRTPLASMLGQMEVALRRDRPAEDYQYILKQVNDQADRLRQIVESLLFLARADAEGRLPQSEKIDLAGWLNDYLASWAGHGRAKDFVVEKKTSHSTTVYGQSALLEQMVANVLDNACKYSPPGTPINLRLQTLGETIALIIEDEGPGIESSDLPHIFDPFFRTSDTRLRGITGHGLGLAIAKRIADALGAAIEVQSERGKGSQFSIFFHAAS
jgi:heavy metal sensor kinase